MIRRFLRLYSIKRNTHLILEDLQSIKFNKDDLKAIDSALKLVTVKQTTSSSKLSRTRAKQEYIDRKLEVIRNIFPGEPDSEYVSMEPPNDLKNPYFDVYSKTVLDEDGNIKFAGTERLSVTKLLTKRWCELNQMYDIYSRLPIFEHRQLKVGKVEHEKLEKAIHGVAPAVEDFMETYEWELAEDDTHQLADNWFQCIHRLLTLFSSGEAREILCHGYIDSRSCQLIEGQVKDDRDILISGIIDHVVLFHVNNNKPKSLEPALREKNGFDLLKIISFLGDTIPQAEDLKIAVGDVKTRPRAIVPNHASVVRASKLQVMYYRFFLENLGKDPEIAYQKLILNATRRDINIDTPINISNLIYFMEIDPAIRPDLERIMLGEPIGFEPFDRYYQSELENGDEDNIAMPSEIGEANEYNLSQYADLTMEESTLEKYGTFYQKWANPPTLRYFAARLAQLYGTLLPLLSNDLMIEYYTGDYKFYTDKFQYDSALLKQECHSSSQFWFGKRSVEPIVPTKKNLVTFCKYCDFHDVCGWRANGNKMFKQLGPTLEEISKL
ncbi:Exo5p [Kluyveromyces lactis]|uniref:Exonuclease V, mitochondrial n=1 Tax=Kluyveromyces lactis (strain ATCC 8585 / CBS 2359 / DSM 70799 / NBRC 1267 / NRRL Y-1140 / WM37) TaxID=284590 RepID=EXO5_KLULA|nr:uncharacterized protein KLLA0_B09680g [Kluyveromyces lactis]Q6CVT0.1 RecName: Full=Exonuclease V, mitochondrial; Short=Exo V; AltName: Full=Defects in morphology protein 1; Flags: Precursor [Kluyveromyces lactis NRRL Y-1140]CAH02352.1 KLLA0B09680p [Kluyveromyces lactis]|eukprot:XP_451959.1 uncharacterized protein KLLA0_B09680g [Kluyveromyces lactis]